MKKFLTLLTILSLFLFTEVIACTSAIFTGKLTPDGRPLMWKHRDTDNENNRVEYFKGEKYSFIALMNSTGKDNEAWTGTNNVGFSIMNTASYNLKNDDVDAKLMDKEGVVMYQALGVCKTLADFEKFLDKYKRPIGVEANFGVIDAEGGAAYYEVNNNSWTKLDANDPKIAPQGYIVYTNFSYTGRNNEGLGYIRYNTADKIIREHVATNGVFTPQWIFNNLSRTFYNSLLGVDLNNDKKLVDQCNGWFIDQDFISRKSSTCSIVLHGVKKGDNPLNTIMWTVLGYPPVGIAVPLMVAENQPTFMIKSAESNNAKICDWVLTKKREIFPIKRGSGAKYLNFNLVKQYRKESAKIENKVFEMANPIIENIQKGSGSAADLNVVFDFISKKL